MTVARNGTIRTTSGDASAGRTAGLVAGAGAGERLGRGPKALLRLAGVTLLERSVSALAALVDEVVVAVPAEWLDRSRSLVPGALVIAGGSSRQESVLALLQATSAELVVVHDVARPFLPADVITRVLAAAGEGGAASSARGITDTLVEAETGSTVDRGALRSVQTPQAFRRRLLLAAHAAARQSGRAATDDAGLVRAAGGTVELVEGSPWLLKLTTPAEFELAEVMAQGWDRLAAQRAGEAG